MPDPGDAPRPIPDPPAFPIRREPAMAAGSVVSIVAAILWVGQEFGLVLTESQSQAILNLVAVVGPLVAAFWVRRRVTPT